MSFTRVQKERTEKRIDKLVEMTTAEAELLIHKFAKKYPYFEKFENGMGIDTLKLKDEYVDVYTGLRANRWGDIDFEAYEPAYYFPNDDYYVYPPDEDLGEDLKELIEFLNEYEDYISISTIIF